MSMRNQSPQYTPLQIVERLAIPEHGGAPTLDWQFPANTLDDFREALKLSKAHYAEKRKDFEGKWDIVFAEYRYGARIHPLSELQEVAMMRPALLSPEKAQFELTNVGKLEEAFRKLSEEEKVDVEISCINRWQMERILAELKRSNIPAYTKLRERISLADTDSIDCLPETLKEKAIRGRERYLDCSAGLERQQDFYRDIRTVESELEKIESLADHIRQEGKRKKT